MTTLCYPLAGLALLACTSLLAGANPAYSEGGFRMKVIDSEWHLAGFENSLDLSGIAAASPTQVLVGSDEMFYVQPGVVDLSKQRIESRRPIPLPVENQDKKTEVDIEGVAFSPVDNAYYIVGSHGLGKKKADFQPERQAIYKLAVDPVTGKPISNQILRATLTPWLKKTREISPFLLRPLQENGLNIEGLAWEHGKLWLGLRAPNHKGCAYVLAVKPDDVFSGVEPRSMELHEIAMEEGRGIREITAIEGGFLILIGNASAPPSKKITHSQAPGPDDRFELVFWDGEAPHATMIGRLPRNGGKGEAILILADTPQHIDALIIYDGLLAGLPDLVRIHRPDF